MSNKKMNKEVENKVQGAHYLGKSNSHTSKSNSRTDKMKQPCSIPVDEDINTSATIIPSIEILGPIT
jgi:hypothetical protein